MDIFTGGTGYKASTILVSQAVMIWLTKISDGNVVIQTYNRSHFADAMGATDTARLYCTNCKAQKVIEIKDINNDPKMLDELEWAKEHKHSRFVVHDVEAQVPNGERKLKVVF